MIEWRRALVATLCGGCGRTLAVGIPMALIRLPGVTATRVRCVDCQGPPPPDLPALSSRGEGTGAASVDVMTRLAALAPQQYFDWKTQACGGGEDGE